MPRFTPYIRRKKVATLGSSWSAQTITDTIKRVTGRRISAIQVEFVVTNAGTAPTAQSNQSALTFISELRLKASDYAGGSLRAVRRLSGADIVYLNKEDDIQIDRDLQALMIQTGAISTVYNPSFLVHLSHPNLDETVRHRTSLPLNAPDNNGTGEGKAYVTEDSVLELISALN